MSNRPRADSDLDYLLQKARREQKRQLSHMRPFKAAQILLSVKQNIKRKNILQVLHHRLLSVREVYGIIAQRPLLLIIGSAAIILVALGALLLFVAINPANVISSLQQLESLQYLFELNSLEERYNFTLVNVGIQIF